MPELALWFSGLSDEVKASVGGSLVTILGFFIALQTAMVSWKKQTAIALRMSAADNLDRLCADVTATILRMQLFIERAASEISRIRQAGTPLEDEVILTLLSEDVPSFRRDREQLGRLSQEFSNVNARYSVLFMPLTGAEEVLSAIDEQIDSVLKVMWVPVPAGGTGPNHRRQLLDRSDPAAYQRLADACEQAQDQIAALHGGLRGALTSAIIEMNLVALQRTLRSCFRRRDPAA